MPVAADWVYAAAAGTGVVSGLMIGAVGVGGVILVPVLANLPGGGAVDVKVAVASCMFAYIFAGAAGAGAYARPGSIAWRPTLWLFVGATPAAFAGAFTLRYLSGKTVQVILYVFVLLSSLLSLARNVRAGRRERQEALERNGDGGGGSGGDDATTDDAATATAGAVSTGAVVVQVPGADDGADGDYLALTNGHAATSGDQKHEGNAASPPPPVPSGGTPQPPAAAAAAAEAPVLGSRATRVVVGVVTGFGSAFTGTSGPVIFLPIALGLCGWEVLASLGSAQAVQLPIALAATIANAALADTDGTAAAGGGAAASGSSAAGTAARIDFSLGGVLAASLSPAVLLGAAVAHRAPKRVLSFAVNGVLVASAVALLAKVLASGLAR